MGNAKDFLPLPAIELEEEYDPFIEATLQFEQVAHHLDLEDWIVHRLKHTERELTVHLPLVCDNGQVATFTGFRVQHNTVRGPSLGGVRFSPDAHLSQVKAMAVALTWQCALLDLPFGGSAGAIVCDPQKLSERELQQLTKDYIYALRDFIGPFKDIATPDFGSNDQTMAWMLDSYTRVRGQMELGTVTGKPSILWGLPAYAAATGRGLFFVIQEVLAERNARLPEQQVAIQGFGKVGAAVARFLHEAGARIVAVADISGGLYNENGLDIPALQAYVEHNRVLFSYPQAEAVRNADVLEAPCNILILAATERQLTANNAERLQVAIVLEGARGPTTRAADKLLEARGVLVIPDILANAGGMVASFLEWTQNVHHSRLSAAEVEEGLKAGMQNAYREVKATARSYGTNLRLAAHLLAVGRVAAALRFR